MAVVLVFLDQTVVISQASANDVLRFGELQLVQATDNVIHCVENLVVQDLEPALTVVPSRLLDPDSRQNGPLQIA